jgi:hypothetical protein
VKIHDPLPRKTHPPPNSIFQRHNATGQDYVAIQDNPDIDWQKFSFHQGWLWVDMGKEKPSHA